MTSENQETFDPHSDEDLAAMLESQLLAMRGGSAPLGAQLQANSSDIPEVKPPEVKSPEVKSPEVKSPEVKAVEFKSPEVKAPESDIFSTTVSERPVAPMPLMFSAGEMDHLADVTAKSPRRSRRGHDYVDDKDIVVRKKDIVVEITEPVAVDVAVAEVEKWVVEIPPYVIGQTPASEPHDFPALPGFVRRNFDDLISGS